MAHIKSCRTSGIDRSSLSHHARPAETYHQLPRGAPRHGRSERLVAVETPELPGLQCRKSSLHGCLSENYGVVFVDVLTVRHYCFGRSVLEALTIANSRIIILVLILLLLIVKLFHEMDIFYSTISHGVRYAKPGRIYTINSMTMTVIIRLIAIIGISIMTSGMPLSAS